MQRCWYYPHGDRAKRQVAITFDDGPNPPITERTLAILREYHAPATFFLFGKRVERFPESVRRLQAAGHTVGNHGYSGRLRIGDYDEAELVISHLTGVPTRFFRPHNFDFGAYFQSTVARLPESLAIGADVRSSDWNCTDPDEIISNVLDHPDLGPGSIVNLHDGVEVDDPALQIQRPLPMLEALPRILREIHQRELELVRLDDMTLAEPVEWIDPRTLASLALGGGEFAESAER